MEKSLLKNMKNTLFILLTILIASCAKIPTQSLDLADIVIVEGERMHRLNITLINKMFKAKSKEIDVFIENDFTPKFMENFQALIPDGVDINAELGKIVQATSSEINNHRNVMQSALEHNRIKIVTKLNEDFKIFQESASELKALLESAVEVDKSRASLFERFNSLLGNRLDINDLESKIDDFILKAGDTSSDITKLANNLDESVNSLIKY